MTVYHVINSTRAVTGFGQNRFSCSRFLLNSHVKHLYALERALKHSRVAYQPLDFI